MKRTNLSHFSHVLAAVQRTLRLPGGEIRGLPNGKSIDGLQGLHNFPLDLSEAQKEFQAGRIRSSLDRTKQLEIHFHAVANRWDSSIYALINDIRQGKQLKNLEKLKELKAAQLRMQQLVSPARKAFQDLVTALDHDATNKSRDSGESLHRSGMEKQHRPDARFEVESNHEPTSRPSKPEFDSQPSLDELGAFADNYNFGSKIVVVDSMGGHQRFSPEVVPGMFYFASSLEPPRVIRIRSLDRGTLVVFDTFASREVVIRVSEFAELVSDGVWVLETN